MVRPQGSIMGKAITTAHVHRGVTIILAVESLQVPLTIFTKSNTTPSMQTMRDVISCVCVSL